MNMTSGLRGLQALQGLQVTVITLSSLLLLPNPEVVSDSLVWLVLVSQEPQDLVFRNFLLLSAFSIILTSPAFYLRPLGLSDHLFSYSLSDNPVPSMCQSLEIQPRIAQTPPCTELTVCLCFHFLCQLPPTFSPLPSLHIALSRLDLAITLVTRLLLIFPALCLSPLPGRNQP